jgi:probable phosphoglycerate mutase
MLQFEGQLYVLRHSLTQPNIDGVCVGNSQASALPSDLERVSAMVKSSIGNTVITHLLSSALPRARQTAAQIQTDISAKELQIDERFNDLDFGIFTGQDPRKIREIQPSIYDERGFFRYSIPLIGGESLQMLENRVTHGLQDIYKTKHGSNTALVTHGSVIVMIHKILSGKEYYTFYPSIDNVSHERVFRF